MPSFLRPAPFALLLALLLVAAFFGQAGPGVAASAGSVSATAAQRPAQSAADSFPLDGTLMQAAQRVAVAHWGALPCQGRVSVSWERLGAGVNAEAAWLNPSDAWANAGENYDCAVKLNAGALFDFVKLCTVLTHEYGHLNGRGHAESARDLMSPVYGQALPACVAVAPRPASAPRRATAKRALPRRSAVAKRKAAAAAARRCARSGRCSPRTR